MAAWNRQQSDMGRAIDGGTETHTTWRLVKCEMPSQHPTPPGHPVGHEPGPRVHLSAGALSVQQDGVAVPAQLSSLIGWQYMQGLCATAPVSVGGGGYCHDLMQIQSCPKWMCTLTQPQISLHKHIHSPPIAPAVCTQVRLLKWQSADYLPQCNIRTYTAKLC